MESKTDTQFPRVAIRFCVQCKWNLRAAYYAQELLQTFSETIGEIALIPVTGGIFTITIYQRRPTVDSSTTADTGDKGAAETEIEEHLIWDRKRDTGFPETKELKNRVRNVIDPKKDMGHVDRALKKDQQSSADKEVTTSDGGGGSGDLSTEKAVSASDHASHQKASAAVDDCEECREAAKT